MVDTRFIDLSSILDEVRYKVFDYLWEKKGLRSRDLGLEPYQANRIKSRKRGSPTSF